MKKNLLTDNSLSFSKLLLENTVKVESKSYLQYLKIISFIWK